MNMPRTVILLAAILVGCSPGAQDRQDPVADDTASTVPDDSSPNAGASSDTTAHPRGFGPVRAGMTLAEAERALGASLVEPGQRIGDCWFVMDKARPDVGYMIIEGRVARVDIKRESTVLTVEGAGIGDTEERIRALYRDRVEVQPHKYTDGHYLVVRPAAPADSTFRTIFETDGKRVTMYRTGRLPEVGWVEGCS